MKEGLIKDVYELILKEIQSILTVLYLLMVGIGMLFNYKKYAKFKVNIFEYADIFDFLIAPFQDVRIIIVSILVSMLPLGLIWIGRLLKRHTPLLYSWINFKQENKSWYKKFKVLFFSGLLFYVIFEAANGYANFISTNLDQFQSVSIRYSDGDARKGLLIGKTKDVLFLYSNDNIKVIPFTSIVKEIELQD